MIFMTNMANPEQSMENLENQVPRLSAFAFQRAYEEALKSGFGFIASDASANLIEVLPDGTKRFLRKLEAPVNIPVGTVYTIP